MFSALKIKNFRIYWLGMLISLVGTWIQAVAQSWLVFELTNSAFLLGLTGFLSSIPIFLFSLFGGVLADRLNKRNILILTQIAFMILAFTLAILTQFKLITPLEIMLIAFLNGVIMAFDGPTRQAVVVELVGKQYLFNAIALNSAAFNSSRIIGPALAGMLIATVGMSGCFYINGISFLAIIAALFWIKINHDIRQNNHRALFFKDLAQGLRFIRHNHIILLLITMVGAISLFGISYTVFMPVFAQEVLKVGVKGLGILMSASGIGALAAALILARLGDIRQKGRFLMLSATIFSVSLILFSVSRLYLWSLFVLLISGWASVTTISLINTLLQTLVPDEFRGRVMSVFMFTFAGIAPFGNLIAGGISSIWGVSWAVFIGGMMCSIFFIMINILCPQIRDI